MDNFFSDLVTFFMSGGTADTLLWFTVGLLMGILYALIPNKVILRMLAASLISCFVSFFGLKQTYLIALFVVIIAATSLYKDKDVKEDKNNELQK